MTASSILSFSPQKLLRLMLMVVGIVIVNNTLPAQSNSPESPTNTSDPKEEGPDPNSGSAEEREKEKEEKERPDQFDVFKVNLGQFAVNEARFLYEMQIGPSSSLEFGVGYIYPNPFWFERSTEAILASGFGIYAAFRKYRILNRYFSTPPFRSYFSPTVFYRNSSYEGEWLLFEGPSPELSECGRYNQSFHQMGTSIRFGWQTTQGRLVADFYAGLGIKFISSKLTQTAINRETNVCEELPTTDHTIVTEDLFDTNIIIQGGVKIGIRRNNRDRNFKSRDNQPVQEEDAPPPIYQP